MPIINWDAVGERYYETGLDRGVLYLEDGRAIPWNGLTSVTEGRKREKEEVYYDGVKINNLVSLGEFEGSMSAITYPEEFSELESGRELRPGVYLGDRPPYLFGLCYRTKIGSDLSPDVGYKLHILYNVTAIPQDRTFNSISDDPEVVEFEWEISAIPEEIDGFRPTSSIVIDSRKLDPWLLEDIESMLYGTLSTSAYLPSLQELYTFLADWARFSIEDNLDGTATITAARASSVTTLGDTVTLSGINQQTNADNTTTLYTTYDPNTESRIIITEHSDGTWTAYADVEGAIVVNDEEQSFTINSENTSFIDSDTYIIDDSWIPST